MPPKNREKDTDGTKIIADQKMAEREQLFLQAFEKPTQIYRYLRCRNAANPFMLYRTLTYMRSRSSRHNKGRKEFKVDSLLETILSKLRIERVNIYGNYLNIIYLGLYDKAKQLNWEIGDIMQVTAILYQTSHSKRKEIGSDIEQIWLGGANVTVNSQDTSKCPVVSIPFQSFQPFGESLHKNYKLIFQVKVLPIDDTSDDNKNDEDDIKVNTKLYGSELNLLDKNNRCICEGEYEVALHDISTINLNKLFSPKKSSWITLPVDNDCVAITEQITIFEKCPTLKFQLKWSNKVSSVVVDSLIKYESEKRVSSTSDHLETLNNNTFDFSYRNLNIKQEKTDEKPFNISYKFVYNNNTRQETDLVHNVSCPWCGLNCIKLYTLLKHLKLCHSRFNFTYQPLTNGAEIIVTINDLYDGSPHDFNLIGATGCSFARTRGPVRRTPVTNLLVCRPRRQKNYSLTEFLESDEDELNNQRPYITGHNRLYYHTETYLPVHTNELYVDSEDERDPHWLQQKTIQMIDEFTDVNEGEKELIKIWNLHMMKHGFVGDCQIPIACDMLIEEKGAEILKKNLYRNFVLHIIGLYNFGLLSAELVYKIILKLQNVLSTYPEGQKVLSKSLETQETYWQKFGKIKQLAKDKLKASQQLKLHDLKCTATSSNSAGSSANDLMKPPLSTKSIKSSNAPNTASHSGVSLASSSYIKKGNINKTKIKSKGDGNSCKQSSSSSLNANQLKRKVTRNKSTANEDSVQSSSSSSSRRRSLPLSILPKDLKPRRQSVANINSLPKPSSSSNQTHVLLRKRNLVTKVENLKK